VPQFGQTLKSRDFGEKQVPAGCSHGTYEQQMGKRGRGRF